MDPTWTLYQPNPTKQILVYDMASSSSVLTLLKMHNIPFIIKNQTNAEFMSENGRLPVVIEAGDDKPMCGFKEVFWHIAKQIGYAPSLIELSYIDWIETNFLEAEMYVCWCYEPTLNTYTHSHYTYDLPWPISSVLFSQKQKHMQKLLGHKFINFEDFSKNFKSFLDELGKIIGSKEFCPNGPSPSAMNALIYGHVNAIFATNLHPKLGEAIKWNKKVENLAKIVEGYCPS